MDRATGRLPSSVAEGAGERDLGDEDIIADGGTQIMCGEPMPRAHVPSLASESPDAPSSLDALSAAIPAKREPALVATSNVVPPAPVTQPIHELDPDDLEEEEQRRIERTQPFDRSHLFGAPRPVAARPSAPLETRAYHPSVVINDAPPQQHSRPASVVPVAIEVAPARAVPDATLGPPARRHVPGIPSSNTPVIAAVIAGGLALCAAAAIALVAIRGAGGPETSPKSTPTVAAKPREAQKGAVRSAVIEPPETTPQRAAAAPGTKDEDGTPVYSPDALPSAPSYVGHDATGSSTHGSSSTTSFGQAHARPPSTPAPSTAKPAAPVRPETAPEPAPPPVVAAPPPATPRAAVPPPVTGIIEVPGSLMTVMVDGEYKRVRGGRIVVSCGKHRVNAGRGTQVVDVPCGGVTSVM